MNMSRADGIACKAMFSAIARETFDRYMKWFDEHPEEPWCYWSKDEPIKIEDRTNKELLAKHPEIEDIDDHTVARREDGRIVLSKFCPRLKKSISAMLDGSDKQVIERDGVRVDIVKDGDNFRIDIKRAAGAGSRRPELRQQLDEFNKL